MTTTKKVDNVTTLFLVRPLGIINKLDPANNNRLSNLGFVQAYIGDLQHDETYKNPVFLLFKVKNDTMNEYLEEFIREEYARASRHEAKRGLLMRDYDYYGYIVLVYEFPQEFAEDYKKIVAGQYSKVSEEFKFCFPAKQKIESKTHDSYVYMVFNKANVLRQAIEDLYDVKLGPEIEVKSIGNFDNTSEHTPKELLDINDFTIL